MMKSSLPINRIKTGILEPHDQSWEAAIPRPAALVWYLQVVFFFFKKLLECSIRPSSIHQQPSYFSTKYLESCSRIVVHLQIFDSPRVAGQVDPSTNKALNHRRACQAMILPFHTHAYSYSFFFFMVSFWNVNRGASQFPTQDWIYSAGFWARCSFVFFLSKHGIFMLVCSISLSCK